MRLSFGMPEQAARRVARSGNGLGFTVELRAMRYNRLVKAGVLSAGFTRLLSAAYVRR